mmetsp:Transcript_12482/g.26906  ORF Transcript_12482/g.26906 Transcript_12482/m.26906 type:complete len:205 (-) Transcript_12482:511-1125(-)|eukprot:CAMPEP_0202890544 /NCGR_PEP_ID=MMETSP1392-20130828/908_1 /ASSEMBLY_ACC=CAM_ASM_000868 /TAXON_ID=225041 /ORGANISM="Chlamydomonas chlamydogama, Strain SAG 11-48b" /LENGTH=204 /DNA_ID=CAMNT_0049574131 /DNA_START=149 /DNA_END=763 /DNA_ORIENTATION=+
MLSRGKSLAARFCCCFTEQQPCDDDNLTCQNCCNKETHSAVSLVPQFRHHLEAHAKSNATGQKLPDGTSKSCSPPSELSASACRDLMDATGGKCIEHDVVVDQPLCITKDVCVHGSVTVRASVCITGNVSITGDLVVEAIEGGGGICLVGNVLVLNNVSVAAPTCVTGAVNIQGSLTIQQANVDVSGGLLVKGESHFIAKVNPE